MYIPHSFKHLVHVLNDLPKGWLLNMAFTLIIAWKGYWVKTQPKEPQKVSNVKFYHEKQKIFFFLPFETMVIMAHLFFLTHMNIKKIKLKIHLIQF
jgi:hypothetical protein